MASILQNGRRVTLGGLLTGALLKLSSAPREIPEEVLRTIERFVILLYDRTNPCTDIDTARKKLFVRKNNVELIPPNKAALEEHVKRAVYQGGHVWGNMLVPIMNPPSPSEWAWIETPCSLVLQYTNLNQNST